MEFFNLIVDEDEECFPNHPEGLSLFDVQPILQSIAVECGKIEGVLESQIKT